MATILTPGFCECEKRGRLLSAFEQLMPNTSQLRQALTLPAGPSVPLYHLDGFKICERDSGRVADLLSLDELGKYSIYILVKGHVLTPTGRPNCT